MTAHRIADERPRERNSWPFAVFVTTVLVLLSLPTLPDPLWVRAGHGIVACLTWLGLADPGPLLW